jgi:hypothetical protein
VRRAAMEQEGLFDTSVGGATGTDRWVRRSPAPARATCSWATCAYTIHEAAATTSVWNPGLSKCARGHPTTGTSSSWPALTAGAA